jgi:predicted enzyme related to lactoylglutathione lyase
MNLGFIILYVRDMEQTKAFYVEELGATVVDAISGPNFITLRPSGGSLLGLQNKDASQLAPKYEEQSGGVELSFEVDDVDSVWQRWKEKGVEIVADPIDLPFGRYFLAKDPDGHYVSIYRFAQQPATPPNAD